MFAYSPQFEEEARIQYQTKIKAYLLEREWYKLVDALEECSDYWNYGRVFHSMPTYNTYMPIRTHIIAKPNLNDESADDVSY